MSAQFMRRNIRISVRLTEEEHRLLKEKMARIGVTNQEAFLRKMALDGLVIRLDLPELKQMISLLRYTSNNINQIARKANAGFASREETARALRMLDEVYGLLYEVAKRSWQLQRFCTGTAACGRRLITSRILLKRTSNC